MVFYDEVRVELEDLEPELDELRSALDIDKKKLEISELEGRASQPEFWDDMEESQKVLRRTAQLKNAVESFEKLKGQHEDLYTLVEMAIEENDEDSADEIKTEFEALKAKLEAMKLETLLTEEYDANNAILTFHAGAGGTEAQDWSACCFVCTPVGRNPTAFRSRRSIIWKVMPQVSRAFPQSLKARMHTAF